MGKINFRYKELIEVRPWVLFDVDDLIKHDPETIREELIYPNFDKRKNESIEHIFDDNLGIHENGVFIINEYWQDFLNKEFGIKTWAEFKKAIRNYKISKL